MNRIRGFCIFVISVAVISVAALAQSQEAPKRAGKREAVKPSPKAPQQGTYENPLVVRRLDGEETDERREQMRGEREEKVANERGLVIWTLALAIGTFLIAVIAAFQLAMFRNQLRLMRRTAEDSKSLAEAARLQSRALVASQLPVVAWVDLKLVSYSDDDKSAEDPYRRGPVPAICRPVFVFQNTGPTKILTLYYAMKWEVAANVDGEPHFGGMHYDGVVLRADQGRAFTIGEAIRLSPEQRALIDEGKATLWAYGFVYYNDFLDEGHQMGTIAKWDAARGFVQVVREKYSYHRHQKVYTQERPEAESTDMPVRV